MQHSLQGLTEWYLPNGPYAGYLDEVPIKDAAYSTAETPRQPSGHRAKIKGKLKNNCEKQWKT